VRPFRPELFQNLHLECQNTLFYEEEHFDQVTTFIYMYVYFFPSLNKDFFLLLCNLFFLLLLDNTVIIKVFFIV
jgi:hypothetical protein